MTGRRSADSLGAGIFLIGIGTLFLMRGSIGFFPGILVVIGLAGLPSALSGGRGWAAWQSLFWLAGLAVLFATGSIWPGILVLIGVSMLLGAIGQSSRVRSRRREDISREAVTVAPLPHVATAPLADELREEPAPGTIEVDDHGTAPLSRDDLDVLEAELAAAVEGVAATPVPATPVAATGAGAVDGSASLGEPEPDADLAADQEPFADV